MPCLEKVNPLVLTVKKLFLFAGSNKAAFVCILENGNYDEHILSKHNVHIYQVSKLMAYNVFGAHPKYNVHIPTKI